MEVNVKDIEYLVCYQVGLIAKPVQLHPNDVELEANLTRDYGVTSMRMVLLMTALCDEAGVALSIFTDDDLASLHTPRDLISILSKNNVGAAK